MSILRANEGSAYGRRHGFGTLRTVDAYRHRVPIVDYDDLAPLIDRMRAGERDVLVSDDALYFGETGGTTGQSKWIPVTRASARALRDHREVWRGALSRSFPSLAPGNLLYLANPGGVQRTASGIQAGSLARLQPREGSMANAWFPRAVLEVASSRARTYLLAWVGLRAPITGLMAINPSTLVIFADRLARWGDALVDDLAKGTLSARIDCPEDLRERLTASFPPQPERARRLARAIARAGVLRPRDAWPDLACLICWKHGHVGFFVRQLPDLYGPLPIFDLGHLATEGVFSLPLAADDAGYLPSARSTFLEYLPVDPGGRGDTETRLVEELEEGRRYRLIITTAGGLYRYDMNDLVEVVGHRDRAPLLRFVEKGDRCLSITGEKVGELHVAKTFARVADELGLRVDGGSATYTGSPMPGYVFAYEGGAPADARRIAARADRVLRELNSEYDFHRERGALLEPDGLWLPPGTYAGWRQRQLDSEHAEAQIKHPWTFAGLDRLRQELKVAAS